MERLTRKEGGRMASSRANLSKKAKLIGIGAAIGLVVGAFSVFMLLTYNPPDKQQEPMLTSPFS